MIVKQATSLRGMTVTNEELACTLREAARALKLGPCQYTTRAWAALIAHLDAVAGQVEHFGVENVPDLPIEGA